MSNIYAYSLRGFANEVTYIRVTPEQEQSQAFQDFKDRINNDVNSYCLSIDSKSSKASPVDWDYFISADYALWG